MNNNPVHDLQITRRRFNLQSGYKLYQTRTLCRRCFIPTIKRRVFFINVNYIFIWRYGYICITFTAGHCVLTHLSLSKVIPSIRNFEYIVEYSIYLFCEKLIARANDTNINETIYVNCKL